MLNFYDSIWNQMFIDNVSCWSKGGPRSEGWTREGPSIDVGYELTGEYKFSVISIEDVLAKNIKEINKWHLKFLDGHPQLYYQEYLMPRMSEIDADQRMADFCDLLESIRNGFFGVIFVAEIPEEIFGFKYFRFDGCHRACCMYHLGHREIPVCIFKTKQFQNVSLF